METLFRILATKRVTFGIVCTLAEKLADILFGTLANTLAGVLCWIQLTTGTLKSTFATLSGVRQLLRHWAGHYVGPELIHWVRHWQID